MLQTAIRAARAAGAIQREHFGTLLNVDQARRNDIKLEVDRLCEAAIVKTVRDAHPDHAILAEEGGLLGGDGEHIWIIDPLDGTVNFFYGIPYFCTSVACYRGREAAASEDLPRSAEGMGEPVVAAVYAPPLDELYAAEAGKGATLNGTPIRAAQVTDLSECMVATGFGSTPDRIDRMHERSRALVDKVRKIRCLGAAALDICMVASGRLSAFVERGIKTWDIGAAALIAREAGAAFTAEEYEPRTWDVLATAPGVHEAMKAVIWKG